MYFTDRNFIQIWYHKCDVAVEQYMHKVQIMTVCVNGDLKFPGILTLSLLWSLKL